MSWQDHTPPHFHAIYGQWEATVSIEMKSILHIVEARPRGGHVLELLFDNGIRKAVDLSEILKGPVFQPLLEPDYFAQVAVDPVSGTVVWPNGVDLAPESLFALPEIDGPRNGASKSG